MESNEMYVSGCGCGCGCGCDCGLARYICLSPGQRILLGSFLFGGIFHLPELQSRTIAEQAINPAVEQQNVSPGDGISPVVSFSSFLLLDFFFFFGFLDSMLSDLNLDLGRHHIARG